MKKRILALVTVSVLLVTAFAACKKEDKKDIPEATPTMSITPDVSGNKAPSEIDSQKAPQTILFGGYFSRENATLTIGIVNDSWNVSGFLFSKEQNATPLVVSGPLKFVEKTDFVYEDENNKLTFTFAVDSVKITVNKGTDYSAFAGSYKREEQEDSSDQVLSPENGSALELLGRIALTHYMINTDGASESSIDTTALSFDKEYMTDFLLAYTDLFLTPEAEVVSDISDKYLCYTFSKESLNDLFLTVSAGTFDISMFDVTDTDIISKEDNYYILCKGTYAGGLTIPFEDQDLISEALSFEGIVSKPDGTFYDIKMTLSTKANNTSGSIGTQITSAKYKQVK